MKVIPVGAELANRLVLIMGLGNKDGGVGAARYAARHGARVLVTDLNGPELLAESLDQLAPFPIEFRLGGHDESDFQRADLIIHNPGIKADHPFLQLARERGKAITTPMGMFVHAVSAPYLGITGTKGKTFTTHLAWHILKESGINAIAAGNNCVSPLRFLDPPQPFFVLELSSFELHEMGLWAKSPHIAGWLNLFPDHLDHYANLDDYRQDKFNITRFQCRGDFLVRPWGDPGLGETGTKARTWYFTTSARASRHFEEGAYLDGHRVMVKVAGHAEPVTEVGRLSPRLQIPQHFPLLLAAVLCCRALELPLPQIGKALATFPGIPHRFERVATWRNIIFINDSAASTPQSVLLALEAVEPGPLVLICGGGGHKSLSYRDLAAAAARRADKIILFRGDAASEALAAQLPAAASRHMVRADDLPQAVEAGTRYLLDSGAGTLLLSPGCSGAPVFRDMFARGDRFKDCVRKVREEHDEGFGYPAV